MPLQPEGAISKGENMIGTYDYKKYTQWEPLDSPPKEFDWDTTYRIMERVVFKGETWQFIGKKMILEGKVDLNLESTQIPPSEKFGWIKEKL